MRPSLFSRKALWFDPSCEIDGKSRLDSYFGQINELINYEFTIPYDKGIILRKMANAYTGLSPFLTMGQFMFLELEVLV